MELGRWYGKSFSGVEMLESCENGRYVVVECDLSTYELMRVGQAREESHEVLTATAPSEQLSNG